MSSMKITDPSSKLAGFSSLTGMSEAELSARAKEIAANTIARLSSLDAALVANSSSSSAQATQDAFAALSAGNIEPHLLEDPLTSFRAAGSTQGFAVNASSSTASSTSSVMTSAQLEAAGRSGAARVKGFVDETESTLTTADTTTTEAADDSESTDSMNIEFEQLKNEMNKLSQMQTAMSNVLNSIHTSAMSIINNLKA